MNIARTFTTLSLTLVMVFSLAACGDKNEEATNDMNNSEMAAETNTEFASEAEISDEEVINAVQDLVDLLERMETMDQEESLEAMDEMFVIAAKLQNVESERVEMLLEDEPELKAAIESLDSQLSQ